MRLCLIALPLAVLAGCSPAPQDAVSRAERALRDADAQEAFRVLTAEAAARPEDGEVQRLLASVSFRTVRISGAAAAAARACDLLPESAPSFALKSVLDRRRSLTLLARESAERACALAPESAAAHTVRGLALLDQGRQGSPDFPGAQEALRTALRLDPESAVARWNLAKALVLGDRQEEAAPLLDALVAEGVEFGELLYLRGIVRLRERDFAQAERDFERAALLGATDPAVHFNRARVLQRLGRPEEAEAERVLYERAKEREEYVGGLMLSYSLESGDLAVATELGRVLTELRRSEEAVPLLLSLCRDQPRLPRPHLLLARAATDAEWYRTARFAVERARELTPDNAEALRAAAETEQAAGDAEAAAEAARAARDAEPESAESLFLLLECLNEAGRVTEAETVLAEARRRLGRHPRLDAAQGVLLRLQGRPGDAERALTAALDQRPRRHRWWFERGLARLDLKDPRGAAADFRAAVEIAPHWTPSWDGLARALKEAGDPEAAQAEADARRARERADEIAGLRETAGADPWRMEDAMRLAALLTEAGLITEAGRVRARAFDWGPAV